MVIKDLFGILFIKLSQLADVKFTGQLTININFLNGGITRVKTIQEEDITSKKESC